MHKYLSILLLSIFIVFPAFAQNLSDTEIDYLDEVAMALEATLTQDTYSIAGTQTIDQDIAAGGIALIQTIVQNIEADYIKSGDTYDAYFVLDQVLMQDMSGTEVEVVLTQEILFADSDLYIRFSNVEPAMITNLYPSDWELFSDAASEYEGLAVLNAETFEAMVDAEQATAPFIGITEAMTEVQLLDSETINDQEMIVYQATLDPAILFSDDLMDQAMSLINLEAFGLSPEMIDIEIGDDAFIEYTIYVGMDDGLVHQIDSSVEMTMIFDAAALGMPGDFELEQELTQSFSYFNFNEPMKLPIP